MKRLIAPIAAIAAIHFSIWKSENYEAIWPSFKL
jgi:hypothetical protein